MVSAKDRFLKTIENKKQAAEDVIKQEERERELVGIKKTDFFDLLAEWMAGVPLKTTFKDEEPSSSFMVLLGRREASYVISSGIDIKSNISYAFNYSQNKGYQNSFAVTLQKHHSLEPTDINYFIYLKENDSSYYLIDLNIINKTIDDVEENRIDPSILERNSLIFDEEKFFSLLEVFI